MMRTISMSAVRALTVIACVFQIQVAQAEETCLANSIDEVGRCRQRDFAQRIVDAQLRGIRNDLPTAPSGVDADVVATELAGHLSSGEWFPISGVPNQWMLVVRRGEVGGEPNFAVQPAPGDDNFRFLALLQVEAAKVGHKTEVTLLAKVESLFAGAEAETGQTSTNEVVPPSSSGLLSCVDPEAVAGSEFDSSGGYSDITGKFRWMKLSAEHRVLVAGVSRSEGYAGGGGTFTGEVLLEQRGDRFVQIACYAQSRYQMFGGEWNQDGTRQHPESQAAWRLKSKPAKAGALTKWPDLALVPITGNTPSAKLVWDDSLGIYVSAPVSH